MANGIQHTFFEYIRNSLPPNFSLAEALAELLDISTDSAYRRIRGEKMLSFEEIQLLCNRFKISVDQVLGLNTNNTTFSGDFINASNFNLDHYVQSMIDQLTLVNSFNEREMIYFAKDVPVFHYLMFPELAAFKFFIWMKTLIPDQPVTVNDSSMDEILETLVKKCRQLSRLYISIPGTEILSPENTTTTQWQIEYYREAKLFRSEKEVAVLYDKLDEMNNHMERQAEAGKKFLPGTTPGTDAAPYKLYINDFAIGDNTVLIKADNSRFCFVSHNSINYFFTRDERFMDYTAQFLNNVIRKSILVSSVGEKERAMFFNHTRRQIDKCRQTYLKSSGIIDY